MTTPKDWLEQTWEIKRKIAEEYRDVPISIQLEDMERIVEEEWKKRGWTLKRKSTAASTSNAETQKE